MEYLHLTVNIIKCVLVWQMQLSNRIVSVKHVHTNKHGMTPQYFQPLCMYRQNFMPYMIEADDAPLPQYISQNSFILSLNATKSVNSNVIGSCVASNLGRYCYHVVEYYVCYAFRQVEANTGEIV